MSCADSWMNIMPVRWMSVKHDYSIMSFLFSASVPVRRSMYGNSTVPFLLDDIVCTGNESNLLQCPHSGLGMHNCDSSETAGVICGGTYVNLMMICKSFYYFVSFTLHNEGTCLEGDVRLLRSEELDDYSSVYDNSDERLVGRVEVCIGGNYVTVCDDEWGNSDASVVCRQLGFSPYGIIFMILMNIILIKSVCCDQVQLHCLEVSLVHVNFPSLCR